MSPVVKEERRPLSDVIISLLEEEANNSDHLYIIRLLMGGLSLPCEEIDVIFDLLEQKREKLKDTRSISFDTINFLKNISFSVSIIALIKRAENFDQLCMIGWILTDAVLPVSCKSEVEAIATAFEGRAGEVDDIMSGLLADVPDELRRMAVNLP